MPNMKRFLVIVLVLALAGCATERYYPAYLDDDSGYYIAERDYASFRYGAGYDSYFLYGVYPWWTHSFYSPWFYPYRYTYYHPYYDPFYGPYLFAGWSPSWPYYGGYHGRYTRGWVPYPAYRPTYGMQPPAQGGPDAPAGPLLTDEQRRQKLDELGLARERMYRRAGLQQPGTFKPIPRVVAPVPNRSPAAPARGPTGSAKATFPSTRSAPSAAAPRPRLPKMAPPPAATGAAAGRAARFERPPGDRPDPHRDR